MGTVIVQVSDEVIQEADNIADNVYAPLRGFLHEKDFWSVLNTYRLTSGDVWAMPIFFDIGDDQYELIRNKSECIILGRQGQRFRMSELSIYEVDKGKASKKIFGTSDTAHPGVEKFFRTGKRFVGGIVERISSGAKDKSLHYRTPGELKELFQKNSWEDVVAFQTRNPPHRSHEFLQKQALVRADALLVQPVIGPKKSGDVADEYIIGAYEILFEKYYPDRNALLSTFHTFMRYAGPREAVFHALVRKNFGCARMIVGRDHAGVGSYYDSYAAHHIFDQFEAGEIGISVLKYQNASFCTSCLDILFEGGCKCAVENRLNISGTRLREMLKNGEDIPEGFMRKEVSQYLIQNNKDLFCLSR